MSKSSSGSLKKKKNKAPGDLIFGDRSFGSRLLFRLYLDLPLHCDAEEHDEVHYEYRPEHWHIEDFEKCTNHGDNDALCRRVPAERSDPGQNNNMKTGAHEGPSR